MAKKIFVFGDTGGHSLPLWRALTKLGVDLETGYIPEEIQIIHLGDLIHKGPNTESIVNVVDKLIKNNPGRWIQILGNHEFQHIEGSPYFWRCNCSETTVNIINEWFETGNASASYALTQSHNVLNIPALNIESSSPVLFTHAGLTYDWWKASGSPDISQLESILNTLPVDLITTPGLLLGVENSKPGPVWAIGNTEVFESWSQQPNVDMPFAQIHGHTSSYSWGRKQWWLDNPEFRAKTTINEESRAIITKLNNNLLIGIDPGFSKTADISVQPSLKLVKNG